jgi:hypothetical protein
VGPRVGLETVEKRNIFTVVDKIYVNQLSNDLNTEREREDKFGSGG